jgi:hypothetical protein
MKHLSTFRLILLATALFSLFSCSTKPEVFTTESLSDYMPLVKGKYITYRLDSLVFTNFQRNVETHSYQVKHVVDDIFTDNQGRQSFRIYKYIRDAAGTGNWDANGSYFITPLADQVELVEDNLRVIKLHLPIREGFTWKGNKYFPTDAYEPYGFAFSNDNSMKDWEFIYDKFESSVTQSGNTYTDVYTVEEEDYSDNVPITFPQLYAIKTRSVEKYSKKIGLVYREYDLWEYQPNPNGASPFYIGFGLKMWMIDHN